MELDLGLLKDETYGLHARYVWEASRFGLWIHLNKRLSLHGQAHTSTLRIRQMSWSAFIYFIGRFLYSIIIKNWLWAPKRSDWLIFQHPRCKRILGMYEDIYTDDLIDEIGINKCVVIEKPYQRRHYTPRRHQVFHIEFLSLFIKLFIPFLLLFYFKFDLSSVKNMIHDIETYIENELKQKIILDAKNVRIFKIKTLYINYLSYLFMLKWLKPKKILIVVSYGYESLVWAASSLHIPIVELQHGVITTEHLGYSVPVNTTKKLFPDYLLLFGNYWKKSVDNFPLPAEHLVIFGYPYFNKMFMANSNLIKKENQIVVISQGTIGAELSKFTIKLALIKKGIYKIIYKLHPGEWGRAKKIYSELYEAKEQGLLEVVDTDEPALYTLFCQSRWQIGVYSTALFEGIALGCQLILADLPGVEYMVPLLRKGYAQLVKAPEEIQFNETENAIAIREELFASDWRSNWHKFEQMDLQCRC
jgi:hypothetical protein